MFRVDKDASSITLHETHIDLDLRLPNNRRCVKVIELWESINVEESKVKVLGTKVRAPVPSPIHCNHV